MSSTVRGHRAPDAPLNAELRPGFFICASDLPEKCAHFSVRCSSGSAGFSLIEVLVALAIAAMMTAGLTRFVAGTRANAAKVAERVEMAAFGETLLARVVSSQSLKAARTSGRSISFVWRIDITPAPFTAQAVRMNEKTAVASENAKEQANGLTTVSAGGNAALTAKDASPASVDWVAYRVAVVIEAASGQSHVVDTIRIGAGGAESR
jgi:prepilin-type N-terminal cleavage/methylation domain-containing protein